MNAVRQWVSTCHIVNNYCHILIHICTFVCTSCVHFLFCVHVYVLHDIRMLDQIRQCTLSTIALHVFVDLVEAFDFDTLVVPE